MKQYQELINEVFEQGYHTDDRTGTGTIALFGTQKRWNLQDGFPAVTTKKLAFKSLVAELLWFMMGETNVEVLRTLTHGAGSDKKTIWDDNYNNQGKALGYTGGELGPVYGFQWRNFGFTGERAGVDQLKEVIDGIKNDPYGRRHIVSAWNPNDLKYMSLPPCHMFFQFNVRDGHLDLQWYQRSVDVFLGLPFNIASYALLLHIVANMCSLKVGDLVFTGGNTHIYMNHVEQCHEVLRREPYKLPQISIPNLCGLTTEDQLEAIKKLKVSDFKLIDYMSHPTIKGKMAV
ncbi:thymidylate synthase [Serratia phage 92A1]|nr:thymidylate synthase [Serratia phage 92A1]